MAGVAELLLEFLHEVVPVRIAVSGDFRVAGIVGP